jgi:hypothetical protein
VLLLLWHTFTLHPSEWTALCSGLRLHLARRPVQTGWFHPTCSNVGIVAIQLAILFVACHSLEGAWKGMCQTHCMHAGACFPVGHHYWHQA